MTNIAQDSQTATWNNWKGHGRPQSFTYLGQDRKGGPAEISRLVASVETGNSSWYTYKDADGKNVFSGGVATKFWASPAPAADDFTVYDETQAPCKVCQAAGHHEDWCELADKVAAPKPAKGSSMKPAKKSAGSVKFCTCGCRTPVTRRALYRQGHDAKHVALLFREIGAHRIEIEAAMELLPTDALRAKLAAQLRRAIAAS